jgi:hypothetical protein
VYTRAYAATTPGPEAGANTGIAVGAAMLALGAIAVGLVSLGGLGARPRPARLAARWGPQRRGDRACGAVPRPRRGASAPARRS